MRKVPITMMRGGTSKGVFIQANNSPFEHDELEAFLLDIMGSPDRLQVDGIGGGNSLTSKVAIIDKATRPDVDVNYTLHKSASMRDMSTLKETAGISHQRLDHTPSLKDLFKRLNPLRLYVSSIPTQIKSS